MKVILLQDIKGTGQKNQVIEVSDGYARNFLFPKKLAAQASKGNLRTVENIAASEAHRKEMEVQQAKDKASSLAGAAVTIAARCGREGKLFGAITAKEIAEALQKQKKVNVDKKKIALAEPIKHTGTFEVDIKFLGDVSAKVQVEVVAS